MSPKGRPISVPKVPWHSVEELEAQANMMAAGKPEVPKWHECWQGHLPSNTLPPPHHRCEPCENAGCICKGKCCGQGCSRCKRDGVFVGGKLDGARLEREDDSTSHP